MQVQLTGPKHLTLSSQAVAYIMDVLTTRPYREVNDLINDIFAQLKQQEMDNETTSNSAAGRADSSRVQLAGPADR